LLQHQLQSVPVLNQTAVVAGPGALSGQHLKLQLALHVRACLMDLHLLLLLHVPLPCLLLQPAPACHAALLLHPSHAVARRHCCLQQHRQPDVHRCASQAEQLQAQARLLLLLQVQAQQSLLCLPLLPPALRPARCLP
jgi:hypothetical protein